MLQDDDDDDDDDDVDVAFCGTKSPNLFVWKNTRGFLFGPVSTHHYGAA